MGRRELKWISSHQKEISKYSGKWIALFASRGILSSGKTAKEVIEKANKKYNITEPFILKVPRKNEDICIL